MAERDDNLPNLKICIDNTESDKDDDDVVSIPDADEIPMEYDEDDRSVEFNVRIGKLGNSKNSSRTFRQPSKVYENKSGEFVTGIDVTQKDEVKKKTERAKRFGLESKISRPSVDLDKLYKSLGFKADDLHRDHRGIRLEAIHLRGVTDMHTKDVFNYFQEFGPGGVEWIDDLSCNIVWGDNLTTARAMLKLSKSYNDVMYDGDDSEDADDNVKERKEKESAKKKTKVKKKSRKKSPSSSSSSSSSDEEDDKKKEKPKEVVNDDDDILDLMEDSDNMKLTHVNGSANKQEKETEKVKNNNKKTEPQKEVKNKTEPKKDVKNKSKSKGKKRSQSSSSSSSSGSSSSSSSGSSSSSSSGSSSSSSSSGSSSSSSGSSSEEEMDTSTKETKTEVKVKKKTRKPSSEASSIPWPPGKWRFGEPYRKTKYLFLRYATKADKKLPGAEKRSKFYVEHGNPNFSGMKGFISNSRKRRMRATQFKEEIQEAREAVRAKRDTVVYDDDIFGGGGVSMKTDTNEEDFGISVPRQKSVEERLGNIKPLDDVEEGELEASSGEEDLLRSDTRVFESKPVDPETVEMEKELEVLLKPSPKKRRTMKMYADEVEEQIQAKKLKKEGSLTITTDNRSRDDARTLITGKPVSAGGDLRSKLKRRRMPSWDI